MEQISEGAEAVISRDNGTVVKERRPKRYRHPALDERLRQERTEKEARLLRKAGTIGVPVPGVVAVEKETITMDYVDGERLRDRLPDEDSWCALLGGQVARLHSNGIIHGDLTTSNMIVGEELYLIDFGLGFFSDRTEDRATDLHLLKEVFESTHPDIWEEAMERVLNAYQEEMEDSDAVMKRYEEIADRGRYT